MSVTSFHRCAHISVINVHLLSYRLGDKHPDLYGFASSPIPHLHNEHLTLQVWEPIHTFSSSE